MNDAQVNGSQAHDAVDRSVAAVGFAGLAVGVIIVGCGAVADGCGPMMTAMLGVLATVAAASAVTWGAGVARHALPNRRRGCAERSTQGARR